MERFIISQFIAFRPILSSIQERRNIKKIRCFYTTIYIFVEFRHVIDHDCQQTEQGLTLLSYYYCGEFFDNLLLFSDENKSYTY